jgi:hypothetical protein
MVSAKVMVESMQPSNIDLSDCCGILQFMDILGDQLERSIRMQLMIKALITKEIQVYLTYWNGVVVLTCKLLSYLNSW